MNYQATLDYLFAQLPMYQREGKAAYKVDLGNTIALCEALGNPQEKFKSIHIAGTNGKGSTAHLIASALQEAGYKTGLYTSPHLKDFRERIKINGIPVDEETVCQFVDNHKILFTTIQPSFFEMTVALAFQYFVAEKVDIAVIETGLGGRLDSTNVITPLLSVITNIGHDHQQFLGDTLPKIAAEKAGIIKQNIPVVIGATQQTTQEVFTEKAKAMNANITFADQQPIPQLTTALRGSYQQHNLQTAWCSLQQLIASSVFQLDKDVIQKGFNNVVTNTGLRGRWEVLSTQPLTITDMAHNKEGLEAIMEQLMAQSFQQLHIVMGMVNDKQVDEILPLFPTTAQYYFCRPNIPRGLDAEVLAKKAAKHGLNGHPHPSVASALKAAQAAAQPEDLIFIGGSTFVVAEILDE